MKYEKNVIDKLEIYVGDITEIKGADAIVNAAKPTLMGGSGVDGAIHDAVNSLGKLTDGTLKDVIKKELDDVDLPDNSIRCEYGDVKITEGYGLSKWIIHAVGSKYDGTQTCINKLEDCYKAIMEMTTKYNIKTIAIPVISSGKYGFPYSLASKILITSVSNYLIKLSKTDTDRFSLIEKIYLVVYDNDNAEEFKKIFERYKQNIVNGKQSLYRNVHESIQAYIKDILINDSDKRGYFTIVKWMRYLLSVYPYFFPISLLIRQWSGGKNWEMRRIVIEIQVFVKLLIPILFLLSYQQVPFVAKNLFVWCTIYFMVQTILYILSLIFLADIQKPSANVYRSILLLFINFCEIILDFSFIYYAINFPNASIWEAIDFGLLDTIKDDICMTNVIHILRYVKNFVGISFIGLAFSYFSSSFRQRTFRN